MLNGASCGFRSRLPLSSACSYLGAAGYTFADQPQSSFEPGEHLSGGGNARMLHIRLLHSYGRVRHPEEWCGIYEAQIMSMMLRPRMDNGRRSDRTGRRGHRPKRHRVRFNNSQRYSQHALAGSGLRCADTRCLSRSMIPSSRPPNSV